MSQTIIVVVAIMCTFAIPLTRIYLNHKKELEEMKLKHIKPKANENVIKKPTDKTTDKPTDKKL